jgi:type VI secretion system protein VasD
VHASQFGCLLLVAGALSIAAGCGGSSPPLLRGTVKVDAGSNPDVGGRPSPVVVRVYELKSLAAFNGADFFALFEREQETLGGELVGREEFQLRPAETRPYQRQLQPDTKYIGVAAAFRDLENSRWRQAVPVPGKRRPKLTIGIQAQAVTVMVQ